MKRPEVILDHGKPATAVIFTADGRCLVSAGMDGIVRSWRVQDWGLMGSLEGERQAVCSLASLAGGAILVGGCQDGSIRTWTMPDGKITGTLTGHRGNVAALAVSPDGSMMASASYDRTLVVWDASRMSPLAVLRGHNKYVMTIDFSNDGKILASGSLDGTLVLWSMENFQPVAEFEDQSMGVVALRYTPDGRWLISSGVDGSLILRNAWTNAVHYGLLPEELGGIPQALAVSPDGKMLAVAMEMRLQLWMLEMATIIDRFDIQLRGLNGLAFSADGRWLANAASDHFIRAWDMQKPLNY